MVGTVAGGFALASGWLATRGLEARLPLRLGLGAALGLALWLAWSLLLGTFVSSATAVALGGGALACLWSYRMPPLAYRRLTLSLPVALLACLLMAVGWLEVVGGYQLDPSPGFVLFDLPKIAQLSSGSALPHPLGRSTDAEVSPAAPLASALGADPLTSSLLLAGTAQVVAIWCWFCFAASHHRKAGFAVALGGLALLWGTPSGWLVTATAWDGLSHLLFLSICLLAALHSPVWSAPYLLGLCTLSPPLAVAGALYLLGRTQACGWLLLPLVAGSLATNGASLGVMIAAYLFCKTRKTDVRGLCLASLAVPGALEWAALGLTLGRLLLALWRRTPKGAWSLQKTPMTLGLPARLPLAILGLVLLWRAVIGGEEVFNDEILIRAGKEKVSLSQLFVPHRLSDWVVWRGAVVGFDPQDLQALPSLRGTDDVLYRTGAPTERLEVSALLSALAGGRPMTGWYAGPEGVSPLPATAAYFSTGDPDLLRATPVRRVLQRGAEILEIAAWPTESESDQAATVEPVRIEAWGQRLWYRADGPTGYQVLRNGKPFGPDFAVRAGRGKEIPYVPPRLAGEIELLWSHGAQDTPPEWPLIAELKVPNELPTRSLLTVDLELENPSSMRLSLDELRGLRWTLERLRSTRPDEVSPLVPLQPVTIEPTSSKTIKVSFRTPPEMGTYRVRLDFVDQLGDAHPVNFRSPLVLRTWRRHPLVAVPDGVERVSP